MTDNLRERIKLIIRQAVASTYTSRATFLDNDEASNAADAVLAELRKDAEPAAWRYTHESTDHKIPYIPLEGRRDSLLTDANGWTETPLFAHPPVPPVQSGEEKPLLHHPLCAFPRGSGGCDMDCARDYPQPDTTYATCEEIGRGRGYGHAAHRAVLNGTGKQQCERCATWIDDNHKECEPRTLTAHPPVPPVQSGETCWHDSNGAMCVHKMPSGKWIVWDWYHSKWDETDNDPRLVSSPTAHPQPDQGEDNRHAG